MSSSYADVAGMVQLFPGVDDLESLDRDLNNLLKGIEARLQIAADTEVGKLEETATKATRALKIIRDIVGERQALTEAKKLLDGLNTTLATGGAFPAPQGAETAPAGPVFSDEQKARARARQIMRLADSELYRHLVWKVYVPWTKKAAMPGLQQADAILGELYRLAGAGWMAGDQFSLADAYVYPMLRYISMVPECAEKLAKLESLAGWMEQMSARESVVFSQFPAEKI